MVRARQRDFHRLIVLGAIHDVVEEPGDGDVAVAGKNGGVCRRAAARQPPQHLRIGGALHRYVQDNSQRLARVQLSKSDFELHTPAMYEPRRHGVKKQIFVSSRLRG